MGGQAALPAHEQHMLWSSIMNCERKYLAAAGPPAPTPEQRRLFQNLALRRLNGEPLQYLTGLQGFRKLDLAVGPGVLVPRPETEIVAGRCLELLAATEAPTVIDIGTGSGAIALAIATERPDSDVWAVESSPEALGWAECNVARAGAANVHLLNGDLFDPVPDSLRSSVDLVVSNPPYLSQAELEQAAVDVRDHEPRRATVAGRSGMELYPRLAGGSLRWLRRGGWLVLETSGALWGRLRCVLEAQFDEVQIRPDLAGKLRVAEGRKR